MQPRSSLSKRCAVKNITTKGCLWLLAILRTAALDPYTYGGLNVNWKMRPNPEDLSQLYGWKDLEGFRILRADDSHYGDRFGRTLVIHGNHLIVGADYSSCQDASPSPGGSCASPGKGAVYIFEQDYVTVPYYRWSSTQDTDPWGGYPTSNTPSTFCDEFGLNCIPSIGFCTDSTNSSDDGTACTASTPCTTGACRYAAPFTVSGSKYWGQRQKLQPADLDFGDRFGATIDFDGETDTLVVGAPGQTTPGTCGTNYVQAIRQGLGGDCAGAGAVYVFQKDYGGANNWGQVAKFTTNPGVLAAPVSGTCGAGYPSSVNGINCPGSSCKICTNIPSGSSAATQPHFTARNQHFGYSVSISKNYIAVGCPNCVGNNRCIGRCIDGSMCGRCNVTHNQSCFTDSDCSSIGTEECEKNRCADGSYCTLWAYEQSAGKVFLYKMIGGNAWQYVNQVIPQPTGGFDELQYWNQGGTWCAARAQGVCGTDGTVVCTMDSDCNLAGGICEGGSNGGNACQYNSQCPGSGVCSTSCGAQNIDPLMFSCCRDGDNFGNSVSVFYDANENDYVLAVGAFQDGTSVTYGESYDRSNHGSVYLFQQNVCCMNGTSYATSGSSCGAPYSPSSCTDVWGQVKGILSSGRPHLYPVTPAQTCGQFTFNGRNVPWVSTHTENLLQHYCWHTEKISAIDEDQDAFFGRQVYVGKCATYQGTGSTCLMVTRGTIYADEIYIYDRNKPGYILDATSSQPSGTSTGYSSTQFQYGSSFKNQWGLHRKHCDQNYQCPPTKNSGFVRSSTIADGCTCTGGYRAGLSCNADADCQIGNQDPLSTAGFSGDCSSGQDNAGSFCTGSCECSSGLLCSWTAGSLGTSGTVSVSTNRWIYSTTLSSSIALDCPGGVTDSGTITAVEGAVGGASFAVVLATTAAPFQGIYNGFTIEISTPTTFAFGVGPTYVVNETRVIASYTADRKVRVNSPWGTQPTTSSTYKIKTSATWPSTAYPTFMSECPGFTTVEVASTTNLVNGSFVMIDDEIFEILGTSGNTLTTSRAVLGSSVSSHAVGAAVYIISGTGVLNYGVSGSSTLTPSEQGSSTLQTGGILRRCATITLDPFTADSTDNIYANWYIAITSGVGVAQSASILHYDGNSKLAVIDCVVNGQSWTGYAQVGYSSGTTGQGYGAFSSSGNNPTACRRSWLTPPAYSYRYYRFRVLKARSGWAASTYSPGQSCSGCCLASGISLAELQLFEDTVEVNPRPMQLTIQTATNPGVSVASTSAANAVDSNTATLWTETSTCGSNDLPPLIIDLGAGNSKRVDRYRFLPGPTTSYDPVRWILEGTDDATAAGGNAYTPYGYCGAGYNIAATGACLCDNSGNPTCSTTGTYSQDCFCRSKWTILHDMSDSDYVYSATELTRTSVNWVPDGSNALWAGYFFVPKSTYQVCQNPVDSNGVCNQGPCSEVACAGPTGDVDPVATDYLKQSRSYSTQYGPNTNVVDNVWGGSSGTTVGGAFGNDVTGKPLWGNPVSADRASSVAGRTDDDLMAVGDYSYDDKGAVFLMRRMPDGDYLSYMERYQYYPMPLPAWLD